MKILNWPDIPFWEELSKKSPDCTFYHTPLWHEIVASTFKNYTIATKGFIFEDGTRAVLPFIQTKKGGFFNRTQRLKSSVFGFYGGIISERKLSIPMQRQIYNHICSLNAHIHIEGNPFSAYTLPESFEKKINYIHTIDLARGMQHVFDHLSRGARRSLDRAVQRGVTVRTLNTEEEMSAYLQVYRATLKRWGDTAIFRYPEEFFLNIFTKAGDAAKIWAAEKDGKIIAVLTMFYWNRAVYGFHGAALREYFDCCPNNLLHMEIIKDAINMNYYWYDFGTSGGLEGVIRFKESFGAEKVEYCSGQWKH